MASIQHTALLTVLLLILTLTSGCRIGFRLDDIQDVWTAPTQMAIIKAFIQHQIPLTIGLIGNYIGTDPFLTTYLRSVSNQTQLLEFCSHGLNHENMANFTLGGQLDILTKSKANIERIFPGIAPVVSIIPPYDAFNNDTHTAMAYAGYTHISTGIGYDSGPYPNAAPYRFPMAASTSSLEGEMAASIVPVTADVTFGQMVSQINNLTWTVVMLHAQEFDDAPKYAPNATMMEELDRLLNMSKTLGCDFRLLKNMHLSVNITTVPSTTVPVGNSTTLSATTTTRLVNTTRPTTTSRVTTRAPTQPPSRRTLAPSHRSDGWILVPPLVVIAAITLFVIYW